jgi:diguanylate cyclase (GGDEF)-like protein
MKLGAKRGMIKVFIAKGPEKGRSFLLSSNIAHIGRGVENEVHVNEHSVSRKHARIHLENDQYFIEDLRSRNGTWVKGSLIETAVKVQVQEGAPIAVGNVLLSLGKRCSSKQLPNLYSIRLEPQDSCNGQLASTADRRAREKKELSLIYGICVGMLGSLDLSELCRKALESIFGCLKRIDSGYIFLIDPDSGKLKKIASRYRGEKGTKAPEYSRKLVRRVLTEGKAVMMPNTQMENKAELSDSMEKIGVKSVICLPLVSKLGTKGVIYLQSVNVVHGFRKDDFFFLTALSSPMALSIENALLYSRSKQAEEKLRNARNGLEVEVLNRTAELVRANSKLEKLSVTDGLTGLFNYRYLTQSIESELKRSVRYNRSLALLLIDIDYFKNLNDTYGHLCGDYVIKTVAKLLKDNVRGTDIVARYGGDELAVLLIETNPMSALEVAEKLKEAIGSHVFQWQTQELSVKVSVGMATAPGSGVQDASDLVDAADQALYQAKKAGRDAVVVFAQEKGKGETGQHYAPSPSTRQ